MAASPAAAAARGEYVDGLLARYDADADGDLDRAELLALAQVAASQAAPPTAFPHARCGL
jgi:hypothetical protein